jgi:16S rRNA G966 N2-methylase RsmD
MDTKQFIQEHLHDDVRELALKYHDNAKVDMALALRQIEARQLLQKKVPSWSANDDLLFPPHLSIEQCSSEATAQYKASLLQGNSFADLTGGLGVDCFFIAQHFPQADYVEQNQELCALAAHNFASLNTPIQVKNDTAENYLNNCKSIDCIFLDPARRDTYGRKTVSIADCTPNVIALQDVLLQKARRVMLKLSPMLDISQALKELHSVKEVHVVAVANECKELLLILEPDCHETPVFTCVNLQSAQPAVTFTQAEEHNAPIRLASEVSQYLYEPNAALMKGGCYKLLTQRYNLLKLHPNSHLYTSENLISDFPGRIFHVEGWAPFNKKLRQTLLSGVEKASIATRNFPLSVAELRKTWKITDGDKVFLFATTVAGEQKIVIFASLI